MKGNRVVNRAQTTILLIAMTASSLCWLLTIDVQSDEGNNTTEVQSTQEASNTTEAQSVPREKRSIDFSINGNTTTQNLNFIGKQPISPNFMEGGFELKFFLTRHEGKTIAESYTVRFEEISRHKFLNLFAAGGYIEMEGDLLIKTDPLLHLSSYTEATLYQKNQERDHVAKTGFGFWMEGRQIGKELECPDYLTKQECDDFTRFLTGLRTHLEIEWSMGSWVKFSMLAEYLPQLRFDSYQFRASVSPEFEIKLHKKISFVLMGEIDYDSEISQLTAEPWLNIKEPWETRLTYLFRHEF